jgi:hypothetical protein
LLNYKLILIIFNILIICDYMQPNQSPSDQIIFFNNLQNSPQQDSSLADNNSSNSSRGYTPPSAREICLSNFFATASVGLLVAGGILLSQANPDNSSNFVAPIVLLSTSLGTCLSAFICRTPNPRSDINNQGNVSATLVHLSSQASARQNNTGREVAV